MIMWLGILADNSDNQMRAGIGKSFVRRRLKNGFGAGMPGTANGLSG
jgi:hypothetical protein